MFKSLCREVGRAILLCVTAAGLKAAATPVPDLEELVSDEALLGAIRD